MLMAVSAVAFAMGRHPSAESTSDEIIQSNLSQKVASHIFIQ